jgi:hypothetical protein
MPSRSRAAQRTSITAAKAASTCGSITGTMS